MEPDERSAITRRVALAGGGAGLTAALLAACGGGSGHQATTTGKSHEQSAQTIFASTEVFKFTVVCHDTDGPAFVPLQYGLQDACTLLGCRYDWTGSRTSDVQTMVQDINQAVAAKVDGIATTLIEAGAFDTPVADALAAGIPVIAYSTDVPGNPRMAFIGPNLQRTGELIGKQLEKLLPGGGQVAIFVSTPGTENVQARVRGIRIALRDRPDIQLTRVATGSTDSAQTLAVQNYVQSNPKLAGYVGVDAGSSDALGQAANSANLSAVVGGVDGSQSTLKLVQSGQVDFIVDQQPYLQGFLLIVQLYLYRVSQRLVGIADTDTGLQLITKQNVTPFVETVSRFEGTSSNPGVQHS